MLHIELLDVSETEALFLLVKGIVSHGMVSRAPEAERVTPEESEEAHEAELKRERAPKERASASEHEARTQEGRPHRPGAPSGADHDGAKPSGVDHDFSKDAPKPKDKDSDDSVHTGEKVVLTKDKEKDSGKQSR